MFDIEVSLDSGDPAVPIVLKKRGYASANLGTVLQALAPALASWPNFLPPVIGVSVKQSSPAPSPVPAPSPNAGR